jgi:hypothetical protein
MAILFTIVRNGNDFSCTADGGRAFFVGRRVPYEGRIGLYNIFRGTRIERLNYAAADFTTEYGFWASLIEPTAIVEGRNFLTLNTYDRARFTFGFAQFAAHVANGDFVRYFRAMLALRNAGDYFPHIGVVNGRICKTDGATPVALESDDNTRPLMNYLNPDSDEVQDAEVIAAAKFIHWTSTTQAARSLQVEGMVATFRDIIERADRRVGIDGRTADLCAVIADILHQGRGGNMTWPLVEAALRASRPFDALIDIGAPNYETRRSGLKSAIRARPQFREMRWSRAAADFVPAA